jgi:MoaA/NifB/PqqE/SkfB family radical SAM enzyme
MSRAVRKYLPRLPLDGRLDLTYRCNNTCQHCWLWLPPDAPQHRDELSFDEIRRIVDEARRMGCQAWAISGGEPMLRPDFAEIMDYITRKSVSYKLNTNGTLITPAIAHLLTRRGNKMVALYGATADVHDHVTRTAGSFEAAMRGFAYLQEAGADFVVQIVPMRANYHQYEEMVALAQSLSPYIRIGAPWLWLSATGSEARNREIARQRLDPAIVVSLDEPDPATEVLARLGGEAAVSGACACGPAQGDERLYAACIADRRDFHIDPYGQMSFCCYIKDAALRFDLRRGTFQDAWETFIPSLADAVRGGQEYLDNCGSCDLRRDCRWCAVYAYLEHGRYSARVDYLCQVAAETRRFKEDWKLNHLRYYQIAGITIQVATDFPITDETFSPKFAKFRVDGPGEDTISLRLVSPVPPLSDLRLGQEVHRRPPWAIYRQSRSWAYLGISSDDDGQPPYLVAITDDDHSRMTIWRRGDLYQQGNLHSLTTFPSDQILLAPILAHRQACILHASGIIIDGKGLLFVGHSDAGKSTMLKMLRGHGEILCDDRIIVRRWPEGFRIHGTWSHGELPDVSPAGAPLRAIMYLEQAPGNELIPLEEKREQLGRVLSHVVKPLETADWWEKTLDLAGKIAAEVPAYRLRFDKSGGVVDVLKREL